MSNAIVEFSGYAVSNVNAAWRAVSAGDEIYDYESFRLFTDGPPPAPEITQEELASAALMVRDKLLSTAAIRVAPLQDAVDLEKATPEDKILLKRWKQYRIDLNDIQSRPGFPSVIEWPVQPE